MLYGLGEVRLKQRDARIIAASLKPDDTAWSETRAEDDELVLRIETPKLGAMLNAYDDYFLNLIAARSVLEAIRQIESGEKSG